MPTGEQLVIDTADALTALLAENKRLKSLLGENGQDLWSMENQRADRLEAENEKLRTEVKGMRSNWYKSVEKVKKLRAELENYRKGHCAEGGCAAEKDRDAVLAELERVKAERDAVVEAVKNMAEYIVCAGRVDYFLCDEISQEHHLKYQPKNDGNYDNGPCYDCVKDWFLQGHKWQGE